MLNTLSLYQVSETTGGIFFDLAQYSKGDVVDYVESMQRGWVERNMETDTSTTRKFCQSFAWLRESANLIDKARSTNWFIIKKKGASISGVCYGRHTLGSSLQ